MKINGMSKHLIWIHFKMKEKVSGKSPDIIHVVLRVAEYHNFYRNFFNLFKFSPQSRARYSYFTFAYFRWVVLSASVMPVCSFFTMVAIYQ